MWTQAVTFTSNCLQQCMNWFHTLMNAAGVSDGTILGFFSALGISALIIGPIRGKALGSDLVKMRSKSADGGSKNG